MSRGRTSKVRLGLLAALVLGLFAFVVAPSPAVAAEGSIEKGGLTFTAQNGQGITTTGIDEANGIVTITGTGTASDPDVVVTQHIVGVGTAQAIALKNYAGTITLDNVSINGSAASAATILFDSISAGNVVLTGGTKIGAQSGDPAINMTCSVSNSLTISGGSTVTGDAAAGILVNQSGSSQTSTIAFENGGGTVSVKTTSKTNNPNAVSLIAGSLIIQMSDNGALTGAPAIAPTVAGEAGHQTGTAGTDGSYALYMDDGSLTIEGQANLNLTGGAGVAGAFVDGESSDTNQAGSKGAAAFYMKTGSVSIDGPTINAVGGNGASAQGIQVSGTNLNTDGGSGVSIAATTGNTAAQAFSLLNGTLNANGGVGGSNSASAEDTQTVAGASGGDGINVTAQGYIFINGGIVNANGGIGGTAAPTAVKDKGTSTQGIGGIGIAGGTQGNLTVQYDSNAGATSAPVVTAQGGMNGSKDALSGAITGFGASSAWGTNITINTLAQGRKNTNWLWIAMTKADQVSNNAYTGKLAANPVLRGFAGMLTESDAGKNIATPGTPDPATAPTLAWAQITTAPIASLSASVMRTDVNPDVPAAYLVAQTEASATPSTYTYAPAVSATFEGISNLNTSKFGTLSGLTATGNTGYEPAANVGTTGSDFYIKNTAEGNMLTVTLGGTSFASSKLAGLYDGELTLSPVQVPVVYTVVLEAGPEGNEGNFIAATTGPQDWTVYTNPNGSGSLVLGTGIPAVANNMTTGAPDWPAGTTATAVSPLPNDQSSQPISANGTTQQLKLVGPTNSATGKPYIFLGYFDETSKDPSEWTQIPVTQLTGWNSNATITAEWGTVEMVSVQPTPSNVEQGKSVDLTATWTVTPTNEDLESYDLGDTGINLQWKVQFISTGSGAGSSNGVTTAPANFSSAANEDGTFTVTATVAATAKGNAELGHYRVWPQWQNPYTSPATPMQGAYGIVNVLPGSGQPAADEVNVIRMYNPNTGEHLYTTDPNEAATLENTYGWDNENVAWVAPSTSGTPIWRLYNPYNGDHLYTISEDEYDALQDQYGWRGEGIKLYSAGQDGAPIYRLYNPNMTANAGAYAHLWTGDYNEYVTLWRRDGWTNESVAFYAISVPNPS